ncbi:MAG TPA: methyltransferase domain-containing protein [Gemmatimonadaceae bacterium]|nr:methyltransferase domain-containing protein [Gemmatimonadaceae bacterium]
MIDKSDLTEIGKGVTLNGDALVGALTRRFRTSVEDATVDKHTFSILRPANSDDLIREEDFVKDERLPYWADVWPSSIVLAGKLMELKGRGKTALELGCGVGLSTLAATSAGFDVLSTDYYEDALDVTRANVFRNLGKIARTRLVDWRHLPLDLGTFDLVFASDVLYEKEYAELLPVLLRGLLAPTGVALIADPGRVAAPVFVDACAEHGLMIRNKETRPFEAGEIKQKIDIYEITNADASDCG